MVVSMVVVVFVMDTLFWLAIELVKVVEFVMEVVIVFDSVVVAVVRGGGS